MNNLGMTIMSQPLFSRKGAAAPSPTAQSGYIAQQKLPSDATPDTTNEQPANSATHPASDLTGLIKRANPQHLCAVVPANSPYTPPAAPPEKKSVAAAAAKPEPTQRRQLTLRIDMKTFKRLDDLARLSGQTYQKIQAKAVEDYLQLHKDNK